ncbi:MAG: ABC transporter substrate-binding protein [Deltaproteobacteria bacterium]|nr:ABC transporter substrate-binding protein [Deltaproteobacteria bacterium]
MFKKTSLIALAALFLTMLLTTSFVPKSLAHRSSELIKLGGLTTRVGVLADIGKNQEMGAEMAVAEINEKGGVLGRKIQIIWRDTKLKPDVALREAKSLVFDEKVDYLFGSFLTSTGSAVHDFVRRAKKLFLSHVMATFLTEERFHPYFFRYNVSSTMMTKAQVLNLVGRGFKRMYVIAPDYAYGHQTVKEMKGFLAKLCPEIKVVGECWPPLGEKDFTPYITKIMRAKVDCVYSVLFGGDQVTFIKQAKPFGFFEKIQYAGGDFAPESLRPLGLEAPEGLLGASYYEFHTPDIAENREFVKRFRAKYGEYPGYQAALCYTAIKALAKAIKVAGTTQTEAVIKALESIRFNSPLGENLYFRSIDHQLSRPLVVGETAKWPGLKQLVINHKAKLIPAEQLWHSVNEIKKKRRRSAR